MRTEREITGCLRGFDDFFNMVVDNASETEFRGGQKFVNKLDSILLNGSQICLMVPGGCPDNQEK